MWWKMLAGGFLALLFVAAFELQGLGLVLSEARALFFQPKGPDPQEIVEAGTPADGATTFLAGGDIAACKPRRGIVAKLPNTMNLLGFGKALDPAAARAHETANLAKNWSDAPIFALGDTVYRSGQPIEFSQCFEPVWGSLKSRLLPAPGNHEYNSPRAFGYFDYFGAQAGPDRRGWYAVHAPGWVILSLNSEVDASPASPQSAWLRSELAEAGDACILAFYHKPAYSLVERDGRGSAVDLFRQLQQAGTTLVLNGHNHFYERTVPLGASGEMAPGIGTVAFTVGTGGRTNDAAPDLDSTAASVFGRTGLLRLELRNGSYSWAYIDALSKDILDEGTAPCNPMRG